MRGKSFLGEWKAVFSNKKLWISIIAVMLVPIMYAGMFLWAFWDPYDKMEDLPVAVVNLDTGAEYNDTTLELGNELVKNLKDNESFKFEFVDKETGYKGLENMDYYLLIEIPDDFSENATTLLDDQPHKLELKYVPNEGYNFLAAQVGETAIEKVKEAVATEVTTTYSETIFEVLETMADGFQDASSGASELYDGLLDIEGGAGTLKDKLALLAEKQLELKGGISTANSAVSQLEEGSQSLSEGLGQLEEAHGQLLQGTESVQSGLAALADGNTRVNEGLNSAYTSMSALMDGTASAKNGADALNQGASQLVAGIESLQSGADSLKTNLSQWSEKAKDASSGASDLNKGITQLEQSLSGLKPLLPEAKQAELEAVLSQLKAGSDSLATGVSSLASTAGQLTTGADSLSDGTGALLAGANQLSSGAGDLSSGLGTIQNGQTQLYNGIGQLVDGSGQLTGGISQLQEGQNKVVDGMNTYEQKFAEAVSGSAKVTAGLQELSGGILKLEDGSEQISDGANQLAGGATTLADGVSLASKGSEQLKDGLTDAADVSSEVNGTEDTYDMIADPVNVQKDSFDPVPNYGTGFAPYFISLGLFVGALMLSIIYPLRKPAVTPSSALSWFLSKFAVLAVVGLVQALLADAILLGVLKIEVQSVPLFIFFSVLTSFVFLAIIQCLVTCFENPGRFMAIIMLILQLTTSAGTFPVELIPNMLQKLNAWFPMTYTVRGFKAVISTGNYSYMWENAAILAGFMVLFLTGTMCYFFIHFKKGHHRESTEDSLTV
ncbi:MAG: YhgE/Pip family protein [Bacillus sp. (in: firmicutes)]